MAKMKWTKPSAETVAYFERIAPGPPIQVRRMFGMPARFLNGHMLVAVFGNTFMLHLSAPDREACIRAGAKRFAPMGREAREYVDIPPGTFDDRTLKEWIVRGMRYLGSLPPKLKPRPSKTTTNGSSRRASAAATPASARSSAPRRASATAAPAPARSTTPRRTSASPAAASARSAVPRRASAATRSSAPRRAKSKAKASAKAAMNGSPAKAKKTKSVAKKSKKRRTR